MNGLHELTAAGVRLTIAGREYHFSPLRLRDWGEIERRILERKPDPLAVIAGRLGELPEGAQRELLGRAYDEACRGRFVSQQELGRWLATPEGRVVMFWLSVRQRHPEVTLEAAEELIYALGAEEGASVERVLRESGGDAGN